MEKNFEEPKGGFLR